MIYRMFRKISELLELGYYIETNAPLSDSELMQLQWLITETFEPNLTSFHPSVSDEIVEIGPRLAIETPFSSNAVSIAKSMGIQGINRIEHTRRYLNNNALSMKSEILAKNLDRMTEQYYPNGIVTFDTGSKPGSTEIIDLIGCGKSLLVRLNKERGLGLDTPTKIDFTFDLFVNILKRNPTIAELLQLGNMNSEHSRHPFFKGRLIIDGTVMDRSLFEIVQEPLKRRGTNHGSIIAFHDNAGAIRGFKVNVLLPLLPGRPSLMKLFEKIVNIICSAETHNHPTAIEPYQGALTCIGGWIRDMFAAGKGSQVNFAAAGYATANLFMRGYKIPGEITGKNRLSTYASPLDILIKGSNGMSAYGNQFGVPLIYGFNRTFEQEVDGEWLGYRKPIMYGGGVGHIHDEHVEKQKEDLLGLHIVRIGGPAYPIGVGGGAASSVQAGESTQKLDFNSVQRGNAKEENGATRVIRACIELGPKNPIAVIHDQGAGGIGNVLSELLEHIGGVLHLKKVKLGDKTMPDEYIWVAEYQEGFGFIIKKDGLEVFQSICERENVNCEILGVTDGSGKVVVIGTDEETKIVDLNLEQVLSKVPQETFEFKRKKRKLKALRLPKTSLRKIIKKVFALPSVGSKGFLANKGDRSVGGLVAQQQCVGVAQIPISDYAMGAHSHFGFTGTASSIGEQPIVMLIDPKAGARMAVGEMLTNLAGAGVSLDEISARANWMSPAKLDGEGPLLYDAANAMSDLLIKLGIFIDGGKDSLSMATNVGGNLVKSPLSLVMMGYAPVRDIRKKVTPDIKKPGESRLVLFDLGNRKNRLGGSALAQAYNQLGDECPDVDNEEELRNTFLALKKMINEGLILAMHDRSDGGLFTAVAEMCMASRCGFNIVLRDASTKEHLKDLFNQELGFILELDPEHTHRICDICDEFKIKRPQNLGCTLGRTTSCSVSATRQGTLFESSISELRSWWENTSFEIEKLQMNPECAMEEYVGYSEFFPIRNAAGSYALSFTPKETLSEILNAEKKPRVGILREEGTNGDREMQAACFAAGLEPWDVAMSDLLEDRINLDSFQGIVFAGGFSYMDVFDSAKGWAGKILFNPKLKEMFDRFYARSDTFSLGVCNGCQLMALLGWVPWKGFAIDKQPRFIHNISRKFESRWAQVEILRSPSVLLSGMEGSKLGVWVAHGEGRLVYPESNVLVQVVKKHLSPLRYLDPYGNRTEQYPFNPNGSPGGATALCSEDGRHLAMMPHPERCFRLWQWPWMPEAWNKLEASPWLRMFQNARDWCIAHQV